MRAPPRAPAFGPSSDFASIKFRALDRASRNPRLSRLALRTLIVLCTTYLRDDTGRVAWASVATLGRDLGIRSDSTMREALKVLEREGVVIATHRQGETTEYRLSDPAEKSGGPPPENAAGSDRVTPPRNAAGGAPENAAATPPEGPAPTPPGNAAGIYGNRKPENESRKSKAGGERRAQPSRMRSGAMMRFDEFWAVFPKRHARPDAEAAWQAAISAGASADEIIAGAMRYAADRTGQEDRFTARPGNWLRNERWRDESSSSSEVPLPGLHGLAGGASRREGRVFDMVLSGGCAFETEQENG